LKNQKSIPFDFVLEQLQRLHPFTKPMFGCHAIYIEEKLMLVLRKKKNIDSDNGVWLASAKDHHTGLKKILPSLRTISIFRSGESGWQIIPEDSDHFEKEVMVACDLILKRDPRIGKIIRIKKKTVNLRR
jgi:hypothetical protein